MHLNEKNKRSICSYITYCAISNPDYTKIQNAFDKLQSPLDYLEFEVKSINGTVIRAMLSYPENRDDTIYALYHYILVESPITLKMKLLQELCSYTEYITQRHLHTFLIRAFKMMHRDVVMYLLTLPKSRGIDILYSKIIEAVAKYGIYNALILIAYQYDFDQKETFTYLLNELKKNAKRFENYELLWMIKYEWFYKELKIHV